MREHSGAGAFCVTTAAAAMVTAGFSWLPVLLGWTISSLILLIVSMGEDQRTRGPGIVTLAGSMIWMTGILIGAERAFPTDGTFPFVSISLLLLLWRAMSGNRVIFRSASNLLGLILFPVLAAVVLFGMQDVSWKEELPAGFSWQQVYITIAASSPWWSAFRSLRNRRDRAWYIGSAAAGVGLSLLTHGILGDGLAAREPYPLYRAVQSVRVLGALQRMEALVAAVVLMGGFAMLLWLGEISSEILEQTPGRSKQWKSGLLLLTVFLLEWMTRSVSASALGWMKSLFWGLTPLFALWVVFMTKCEKNS